MLVRGPFTIKWGDNVIQDVEEIDVEHEIDSEDYETVGGRTIEIDGSYKVSATVQLLATDIADLAPILPQHFKANGEIMSTLETVNYAAGAIDVVPGGCDSEVIYNPLDIISCGSPANVIRLVNTRSKIEGVELDNKLFKVMVKFVGEASLEEATLQFFREGTISVVS